jgi:hypothetical protein
MTQHSQVRTDLLDKLYLSLNLRYYFFFIIHSLAPAKADFSQQVLTPVLNKEGFATMYDVTPDKFQTIIDTMAFISTSVSVGFTSG